MAERLDRAMYIARRGTFLINAPLLMGGPIAGLYLVLFRHFPVNKVFLDLAGGLGVSLVLWFAVLFGFSFAFPPPPDRPLRFPGAGRVVWPVMAILILATIWLVFAKR